MTFSEAPLSINFKPGKDFDAPLLTIRASTPEELETRVNGVAQGALFGAIVNAQTGFKAAYNVSSILGGVSESAPAPNPPAYQSAAPAQAQAPAQGGFPDPGAWGGNPGPQAQAQAPQQQYMAAAAAGAPAAAAPASAGAPFIPAFGMSATFRSGQSAKGPWSAYFDPRPKAVTDAIPTDYTGKVPSTDDVNHPGLAAGTHKFSKFIR